MCCQLEAHPALYTQLYRSFGSPYARAEREAREKRQYAAAKAAHEAAQATAQAIADQKNKEKQSRTRAGRRASESESDSDSASDAAAADKKQTAQRWVTKEEIRREMDPPTVLLDRRSRSRRDRGAERIGDRHTQHARRTRIRSALAKGWLHGTCLCVGCVLMIIL